MMEENIKIAINSKFQSSLYAELQVQEILWTRDYDIDEKSSGNRHRQLRKKIKKDSTKPTQSIQQSCLTNKIDCLSDEVLLTIFRYLDRLSIARCSQVSQRWRNIGYDPSLWKKVEICNKNLKGEPDLESILNHRVVFLKMTHCQVLGPIQKTCRKMETFLDGILTRCRVCFGNVINCWAGKCKFENFSLQYLDISLCQFAEDALLSILERCRNLKCLSLPGTVMSDRLLDAIGKNSNLRELNFAMCKGISSNGITELVNGCKNLMSINLSWTTLRKEVLLKVIHGFSTLEEINVSGNKTGVDDEVVQTIVTNCPNLKVLDLSDCSLIGNSTIDAVINHTQIKKISFSRCHRITASKICEIAKMNTLEDLEMFGFKNFTAITTIKALKPSLTINSNIFSPIGKILKGQIML